MRLGSTIARGLSLAREVAELLAPMATDLVRSRRQLVVENIALRQQLAVFRRSAARPELRNRDRWFWIGMRRWWPGWDMLVQIVNPSTVVRWHRAGFRAYWRRRSRPRGGRPAVHVKIAAHVRRMARENPTWGAPRIHAELVKLGFEVSERTVSRYMPKPEGRGDAKDQAARWRTFLTLHASGLCAMDMLTVPTAWFGVLYVWFVIEHSSRRIVGYGVTALPRSSWVSQRLREAFPWDTAPEQLLSDNDAVFGEAVTGTLQNMGIEHVRTSPHSPWQNGIAERWVGTVRRELLDHVVPLSERHLERLVAEYVRYYNEDRPHLSLAKEAPEPRAMDPGPVDGEIVGLPRVGGLHHRYERRKAT